MNKLIILFLLMSTSLFAQMDIGQSLSTSPNGEYSVEVSGNVAITSYGSTLYVVAGKDIKINDEGHVYHPAKDGTKVYYCAPWTGEKGMFVELDHNSDPIQYLIISDVLWEYANTRTGQSHSAFITSPTDASYIKHWQ